MYAPSSQLARLRPSCACVGRSFLRCAHLYRRLLQAYASVLVPVSSATSSGFSCAINSDGGITPPSELAAAAVAVSERIPYSWKADVVWVTVHHVAQRLHVHTSQSQVCHVPSPSTSRFSRAIQGGCRIDWYNSARSYTNKIPVPLRVTSTADAHFVDADFILVRAGPGWPLACAGRQGRDAKAREDRKQK